MALTRLFLLRASGAGIQVCVTALLALILPDQALGPILLGLMLAALGGTLTSAGRAQLILREGSRTPTAIPGLLGSSMLRAGGLAAIFAMLLVIAARLNALPLGTTGALLIGLAALLAGLGNLCAAALRAEGRTLLSVSINMSLRHALAGGLMLVTITAGPGHDWPFAALCLGHAICLGVLMAFTGWPRRMRAVPGSGALWRAQTGWLLLSQMDVILSGLCLTPEELGLYLLARRIAMTVTLAQDAVRLDQAPRVAAASDTAIRARITAANHGFLKATLAALALLALVGGLVLAYGIAIPIVFPVVACALATPALFGATGVALSMRGAETALSRIFCLTLPLSAGLIFAFGPLGPAGLAAGLAIAMWLHGCLTARLVWTTFGVLPPVLTPLRAYIPPRLSTSGIVRHRIARSRRSPIP